MAVKDDASTNIESLVTQFAADMSKSATDLLKKAADKSKNSKSDPKVKPQPVTVKFSLSNKKDDKSRTPAEQAKDVVAGSSHVCWGAHMADKARHVLMSVNGKVSWDAKKVFGDQFAEFKNQWAANMKKRGLKNWEGKDGWGEGDAFHLELPDSKVAQTDARCKACLEEYARLVKKEKKKGNDKFETKYAGLLKPYFKKYEAAPDTSSGPKVGP